MKLKYWLAAPVIVAALLQAPAAFPAGLLGGLVNIGSGDGDSGALVDLNLGGSNGDLAHANVGGLVGADVNLGGPGSSGGTGNVLNADLGIGPANVNLGIGLGLGQGPRNGTNGTNGTNGRDGGNGLIIIHNGGNGANGSNGANGINGTSKLKLLAHVLQNRAWLRYAQRNQLCLPAFGVSQVGTWLPPADSRALPGLLNTYAQDIDTLQALLKNCRKGGRSMLGQIDLDRVIGLDQRRDGSLVLFML